MIKYNFVDSGIEWIEKIPEHWTITSIKKEFQVIPSNVDKKSEDGETEVKLCNYVDVYYNDFITKEIEFMVATATENEINKFQLQIGDVLITKDSEDPFDIAVPAIVKSTEEKLLCGYHLSMIRTTNKKIDGSYLFWALKDEVIVTQLWREACGVTRWAIASRHIKNSTIPFPPKEEQIAIANYLDKSSADLDRVIELKRKQIENLQRQIKSIIHQTITKGLNHKAPTNDSNIKWIEKYPRHWKISRIIQRVENVVGGEWGIDTDSDEIEGTKEMVVLRVADFNEIYLDYSNPTIRRVKESKINIRLLSKQSLLMEKSGGGEKQLVGRVVEPRDLPFEAITSNFIAKIEFDTKVNSHFMNYVFHNLYNSNLNFPFVQQTTGIQNINSTYYLYTYIAFPPKKEQLDIANYLDEVSEKFKKSQKLIEKQIETLITYKKSLIHEVVTGKKQVFGLTKKNKQLQTM